MLRGWAEAVDIKYTPVRTTQICDNVSHWIAAGRPLFNNGPGQPQPPQNASPITRDVTNALRRTFVVGQTASAVPTLSWRGSALLASLEEGRPAPDAFWQALLDPNVFPRDVSVWGNAFGSRTRGETFGLAVEHEFMPSLWADLSLYHQNSTLRLARTLSPIDMVLRADPNMFVRGLQPQDDVAPLHLARASVGAKCFRRRHAADPRGVFQRRPREFYDPGTAPLDPYQLI